MEYYTILSDQETVPVEDMQSRFVDVKKYPGQGHFWRGSVVELKMWEDAKKRAAARAARKKPTTSSKPKTKQTKSGKTSGKQNKDDDDNLDFCIDDLEPNQLHNFSSSEATDFETGRGAVDDSNTDMALLWDSIVCLGEVEADEANPECNNAEEDVENQDDLPLAELSELYVDGFQSHGLQDSDWEDLEETDGPMLAEGVPVEPALPAAVLPDGEHEEHDVDVERLVEAAMDKPERKERKQEVVSRKPKVAEIVFTLPFGELRYNSVGNFIRAHCNKHPKCTKQRQTTPGRLGAGRPIGMLIAWLKHDAESKVHHMVHNPSYEARQSARAEFNQMPGSSDFAQFERRKYHSEDGDEPLRIP